MMGKIELASALINKHLQTEVARSKYLDLLSSRIEDNRKAIKSLVYVLLVTLLAFPLLIESKISDISFGPFKDIDASIVISFLPSLFAFCYYKYTTLFIVFNDQRFLYYCLSAKIFDIDPDSYLNENLKPFSFLTVIGKYHLDEKNKLMGCLNMIFFIPIALALLGAPIVFEFYSVKYLYEQLELKSILDILFFGAPILLGIYTIILIIQSLIKESQLGKEVEGSMKSVN